MKLSKWAIEVLKMCDFFGITFSFMINKERQYKTTFGGFFSILIFAVLVACFTYYLIELIQRSRFTFYTQETIVNEPPPIYANRTNFTVSFSVLNEEKERYVDEKLYQIKMYQVQLVAQNKEEVNKKYTTKYTEIPLVDCGESNPYSKCVDESYNSSYAIQGHLNDDKVSYLEVRMDICINKTNGVECYTPEKQQEKLFRNQFYFTYTSNFIDLNIIDNPKQSFITGESYEIDYRYTRIINYYFKNLIFYSDENLIYVNYHNTSTVVVDSIRDSIGFDYKTSTIFVLKIQSSNSLMKYYRQYVKFIQICVNMGGLINSLFVVGGIVVTYINDIRMKLFIMNRLYDFVEDEKDLREYKRRSCVKNEDFKMFMKSISQGGDRNMEKPAERDKRNPNHRSSSINLGGGNFVEINDQEGANFKQEQMVKIEEKHVLTERNELPSTFRDLNFPKVSATRNNSMDQSNLTSSKFKQIELLNFQHKNDKKIDNIEDHQKQLTEVHSVQDENLRDDSKVDLNELEKIIKHDEERNKKFTLAYTDLFCLTLCCCFTRRSKKSFSKIKLYEKAEKEMAKTFDVVEIYRELHKMSGFINFFFSKKQSLLLSHLERPKIIFKNLQPDSKKKKMEHLIQCFNSYNELKMNLDNIINSKLLQRLDFNMKEIFDKMPSSAE